MIPEEKPELKSPAKRQLSPMRAIRLKCLECMNKQRGEVAKCPITDCSLWPFRFGIREETAKKKGKNVCRRGICSESAS